MVDFTETCRQNVIDEMTHVVAKRNHAIQEKNKIEDLLNLVYQTGHRDIGLGKPIYIEDVRIDPYAASAVTSNDLIERLLRAQLKRVQESLDYYNSRIVDEIEELLEVV